MIESRDESQAFFQNYIDFSKKNMDSDSEPTNYTEAFLQQMTKGKANGDLHSSFTEKQLLIAVGIKEVFSRFLDFSNIYIGDIFGAGFITTLTTLQWFFLYLLYDPDVARKCRKEIDEILEVSFFFRKKCFRMSFRQISLTKLLGLTRRICRIGPLQ